MSVPAIPVGRISAKARQIDVAKMLLAILRLIGTVLVGIPYLVGWALSKAWLAVTLLWTAAAEGWRDARRGVGDGRP